MEKVKLSIIVPVYNVEEYLAECLDSLFNQVLDHTEFEVVAINDGATDNSLAILEEYQEMYDNLRVYTFENSGLAITRNRGIDLAEGRYITFLDSDDITPQKAYYTMLETIEKTESDVVTGPVVRLEGEKYYRSALHKLVGFNPKFATTYKESPELTYDTTSTNKIYKRSFLSQYNIYFPEKLLYEDILFTQKVYLQAKSIDIISRNVYIWRIREGESLSISQNRRHIQGYNDRVNTLIDSLALHDKLGSKVTRDTLANRIIDFDLKLFSKEYDAEFDDYYRFYLNKTKELLTHLTEEEINAADYRSQLLVYGILAEDDLICQREYGENRLLLEFNENGLVSRNKYFTDRYVTKLNFSSNLMIVARVDTTVRDADNIIINGEVASRHLTLGNPVEQLKSFLCQTDGQEICSLELDFEYVSGRDVLKYTVTIPVAHLPEGGTGYKVKVVYDLYDKFKGETYLSNPMRSGNGSKLLSREETEFYTGDFNFNWELILRKESIVNHLDTFKINEDRLVITGKFSQLFKENVMISSNTAENIYPKIIDNQLVFDVSRMDTPKKMELMFYNRGYRSYAFMWQDFDRRFTMFESTAEPTVEYTVRKFLLTHSLTIAKNYVHSELLDLKLQSKKIELRINLAEVYHHISRNKFIVYLKKLDDSHEVVLETKIKNGTVYAYIKPITETMRGQYRLFISYENDQNETVTSQVLDRKNHSKTFGTKQLSMTKYDFETADGYQLYVGSEGGVEPSRLKYNFYRLARKLPINKKKVVFQSYWGKNASCNPRALFDYMQGAPEYAGYKLVWAMNTEADPVPQVTNIRPRSFKYYYHMATAGYFFNNVNFTTPYLKRAEAIEVQTMHGTPLKTIGLDSENSFQDQREITAFKGRISRWDYVISQSEYVDNIIQSAYDFKKVILKTGYPRTDRLIVESTQSRPHNFGNKKVIVYAPTWRVTNKFAMKLDLDLMKEQLGEDYVLVIKPHHYEEKYLDKSIIDNEFIFDGREFVDLNDLLLLSDIMITDYSSIMIDYLVQHKPTFIFAYDYRSYASEHSRGLYFDMSKEFSDIFATETQNLVNLITTLDADNQVFDDIRKKFITYENANSSKSVLKHVLGR